MPSSPTPARTAHDRSCAEKLRLEFLIKAGTSTPPAPELHRLALTIHHHCGHSLLKAHRLAWGLTVKHAIAGVSSLYGPRQRGLDESTWHRWERAGHVDADYQHALATFFGVTAAQLGLATDFGSNQLPSEIPQLTPGTTATSALHAQESASSSSREAAPPPHDHLASVSADATASDPGVGTGWPIDETEVRNVADQSAQFGDHLSNVGPLTLDRLHTDAQSLARSFSHASNATLFKNALALRNRVFSLLDARQRVSESRDLYFLGAVSLGMLAEATQYLGYYREAMTHVQTGLICAKEAAHPDLTAWLHGEQSLIAYLDGRPGQAVTYATQGQQPAATGSVTVWVHALEARAAARRGDARRAREALEGADAARGRVATSVLDSDYGGILSFSTARQTSYSSGVWLALEEGQPARKAARSAIDSYRHGPADQRAMDVEARAQLTIAEAHLLDEQLAEAQNALDTALAYPADALRSHFRLGLRELAAAVSRSQHRGTTHAGQIQDQIEDFLDVPAQPGP